MPVAGPQFNAYDAYVSYDPRILTFLQYPNIPGPAGTADVGRLPPDLPSLLDRAGQHSAGIHHSLLCAGIALTGPGVLYHLRFRAKAVSADAWLRLESDASMKLWYRRRRPVCRSSPPTRC